MENMNISDDPKKRTTIIQKTYVPLYLIRRLMYSIILVSLRNYPIYQICSILIFTCFPVMLILKIDAFIFIIY